MVDRQCPGTVPGNASFAVENVEITDPTSAGDSLVLLDMDAVKLRCAPFLARRTTVRAGNVVMVAHSTSHPVRTRSRIHDGVMAFTVFGPAARGTVNGMPVRPGLMLMVPAGIEVHVVVRDNWETVAFIVPQAQMRDHIAARQWHRVPLSGELSMLDIGPSSAQRLFDWGRQLGETATEQAVLFNECVAAHAPLEAELVDMLLDALGAAVELDPASGAPARLKQDAIVRCAEDHALSRHGATLYVGDLCRAAGVSERTLEYAFRNVLGLTPTAYLTRLRLHRVRQALLAARPGTTRISVEALRWGFWHLSEFSRAYRDCFGELPSDTLNRDEG